MEKTSQHTGMSQPSDVPIADSVSEEKSPDSISVYNAAVAVESCTYTGPNIRIVIGLDLRNLMRFICLLTANAAFGMQS